MGRTVAGLAVALALAACGDVTQTKLTGDILNSPAKVQKIATDLKPADRPVFARYLLSRGGGPVLQILNEKGEDPATVGEALALTRGMMALEAEREAKQAAASAAMEAAGTNSITEYNAAVQAYNAAQADFSTKAKKYGPNN
jgi:hypothetical protein